MLLVFRGETALSDFRRLPLLARCRTLWPDLDDLTAEYFFMAHLNRPLAAAEQRQLRHILGAGPEAPAGRPNQLAVCPRPGTISPWSSKATDILHNCGFDAVERIERGIAYTFHSAAQPTATQLTDVAPLLHDRMTEAPAQNVESLFERIEPQPLVRIPVLAEGRKALERANSDMGLALAEDEVDYFLQTYQSAERDPTDVELMMFSVVNSEHCRHKIFNADWKIDGDTKQHTLFDMIRNTHAAQPEGTVKAYSDNSGILQGYRVPVFRPEQGQRHSYVYRDTSTHVLIKVETHNHPTAISPYPGASTGVGGEIRDEGAAGTGGVSQAGLCAFFTSHLRIPDYAQPWERDHAEFPARLASPLQIMTEGPIGGAAFGNEFGRPNILGLFRTYEDMAQERYRGYHKPIMVAGGVGMIDDAHVEKGTPKTGDYVVQLGGPAMLIGLGGGAASSMDTGSNQEELDFASVQRDNPEMERRCQELISRCIALGEDNPIVSIHDVGAGGLSNACPELVEETGAHFQLRAIHNDDPSMSPMQIWCNEAQERYVLVIGRENIDHFCALAERERCLYAVIGEVTGDRKLTLSDEFLGEDPIPEIDLDVFLGKPPRMLRDVQRLPQHHPPLNFNGVTITDAASRVLRFPAVAAKNFLITIADRTVTGLIVRDQFVGPYQVPVADVALTAHSFKGYTGSAMAMGERTPVALIDAPASGRLAVAEAITNIAAAHIGDIQQVKLSGNWMCACGEEGEDANLFDTVQSVGMEFCPQLGVAIPVGKDSLSMRAVWQDSEGKDQKIVAPLSLVVSAFAPVEDARRHATPQLRPDGESALLLLDLGHGKNRLGGSCLAQAYNQVGQEAPDVDPGELRRLFDTIQHLHAENLILAYHDRSDGGLFSTVAEMAFAGRCGVHLDISSLGNDALAALFSEEIGVVIQHRCADAQTIDSILEAHQFASIAHPIGRVNADRTLTVKQNGVEHYRASVLELHAAWNEMSYRMQAQRDNPTCAREEFEAISDANDPGLSFHPAHDFTQSTVAQTASIHSARPRVAVLREQGINGQVEMAAAFDAAGFEAVDVPMTDLIDGRAALDAFHGLVACGGFSYGDVLGAGAGWARSILFNEALRDQFAAFFADPNTFSLGVCNGCQMLSHLKELIPGSGHWPRFLRNRSEQFEARVSTVEITESRSVLLSGMQGSRLPIAVAHGEGRVAFDSGDALQSLRDGGQLSLRYVDNYGQPSTRYPTNPNGSPEGITGLCSADGRATIMMPHPERVFRAVQLSHRPDNWQGEAGPWLRLFQNARAFVD
ncbi:MAG: phosphoribosylformylglycinamidine synthase [Candidatus Latescibacterota bacterium]|nr:phosphoribosylformylglycinamidine synthase [Candidatus Latescibacterota bacterium]